MMADTISRYKEGKPVFYYTRTPYWVSNELKPGERCGLVAGAVLRTAGR